MLILKIIFKNKKIYYFNIFINKKYFKKQSGTQLIRGWNWTGLKKK